MLSTSSWICSVRLDRADSADAAVTLRLHRNGCWLGFRSGSDGDRCYGTPDRTTGEENSGVLDDWVGFHRPRVRHVVLRELQSCDQLRKRSLGTRGSGLRDRLLVCPDQPARLLLFAQEQKQQSVEPDQPFP